jgi:crossover junction endodeoxyribonuclease RuvC
MKVIGIDLSLTGTGLAAIIDGQVSGTEVVRLSRWAKKAPQNQGERLQRFNDILGWVNLWTVGADLVVMEGLAFDAHDTARQLAGLSWLAQRQLWLAGIPTALITPSKLKLYAVGKGSGRGAAGKLAVTRAADRQFPNVEIEDDNAADALWLAAMGARHLGQPVDERPEVSLAALVGVEWPTVAEVAA